MTSRSKTSNLAIGVGVLFFVFVALFVLRYLQAIDSGVDHVTAVRTYVFWAAVVAPVAYLADILGRTIANYRLVRLAVARVQTSSRRR